MKNQDRLEGVFWVGSALAFGIESVRVGVGRLDKPGPGLVPLLIAFVLAAAGSALLFRTSIHKKDWNKETKSTHSWKPFSVTLVGLVLYAVLLDVVGFYTTSLIILTVLFGVTDPGHIVRPCILAIVTVIICYGIFSIWLKCQFPTGWLM
jgi:hypothetical protein